MRASSSIVSRLRLRAARRVALALPMWAVLGFCAGLGAPGCGLPGPGTVVDLNGDPGMGVLSPELLMSSIDPVTGVWESAPFTGTTWIAYSPRTQIHISHPLGRTPRAVLVYLSFVEAGTTPALAAGDLARLIEVTDSDVTVWNDTNGRYFARIVIF